ncbi:ABC transporter permease, partial [Pseudomonas aeruginosa]
MAIVLSPLHRRRLAAFRANRRGRLALLLFLVLFVTCLFAELIANDRPLLLEYRGQWFLPVLRDYPETAFGGELPFPPDYRGRFMSERIARDGWALWPPIRFDARSINYARPAPAPPSAENWLGTDDQGRDVLARVIYGLRLSILFALGLTLASSLLGICAGAVQGYYGGWIDLFGQRFI